MATLINGNGNPRIYAAQDADLIAALAGDITGIAQIGNKFAATAVDANTISVADGVIVTKEGRRIQLDAGSTDMFVIPTGTTGVTNYYIIGYKLTTQSDDSQIAETFVRLMSSSSETITEDTFREGATDVYVSLYRVEQDGVNLGTITGLLSELTNISKLKSDLSVKKISTSIALSETSQTYSNNDIKDKQYIDVYIRLYGESYLSKTVRLYPYPASGGSGVLIFDGNVNYIINIELIYNATNGTLTHCIKTIRGWGASSVTIPAIFYQN